MTTDDLHAEFTRALTRATNELRFLDRPPELSTVGDRSECKDSICQALQAMVGVHEELLARLKQADEQAAKAIDAMRGT